MKLNYLLSVFFVALVFNSCTKEFPRRAAVLTESMDKPTAVANGKVIDLGQSTINDHGFCWDSMGFPSMDSKVLQLGKLLQTGGFSAKLPGLSPNRVYYLKAWVSTENGLAYGDLLSFTTPDLPSVVLQTPAEVTDTSASCNIDVSADGGAPIVGRGLCWNTQQTPDTNNFVFNDSIHATGSFNHVIPGLTGATKYFVRAFARNIYGIRYSDETTFTTAQGAIIPVVTTADVSNIGINSVTAGGNVTYDGGAAVTMRGVCWNTSPYPTIDQHKTIDGTGEGQFVSAPSGLNANTTYYLRAYATNVIGTSYGEEKSFTTLPNPGIPSVITASITNITSTTATSGGTVLNDGGAGVTARGVCWSTSPNPTTSNTHTLNGSGVGSFVSEIISLVSGTKYYVRAYATNSAGTAYGNEGSFTAGQSITAPTVTTTEVVNVAQTTATCGGNVTSDGGAPVTLRGVCWSTSANPTTANSKTENGTGTGGYLSSITGLIENTTYHVRAYATNSAGTSYGNERTFTTLTEVTVPAVTTAPVTNVTNNSATSGGTVTNDGGASVAARGVCWSVNYNPTIADPHSTDGTGTGSYISQITGLLPNTFYRVRAYATNSAGTSYGNQQTFSTLQTPTLPTVSTTAALNITPTTATTGGTVNSDGGSAVTVRGVCYSTSPNPTLANSFTTDGSGVGAFVSNLSGLSANTIYYVKAYATNGVGTAYGNEITFTTLTAVTLATVTTTTATNITQTTATSGGNVTSDGGTAVTARGVCWSTFTNPTTANSFTTDGSGTGVFVSNLAGLTANTLYYVRAYATNSVGTAYGNEITFTTTGSGGSACPGIPTVTYEGKVYNTVLIGTQCWFKENLNVGTRINGSQSQTNNGIKEKYCYNDLESNCDVYGGLYQWDEAMQYVSTGGTQGLCPSGWHIPTDAEWTTLTTFLGGESVAGGKMKEAGTTHWASPNTGATNSSGFTALPGGDRDINGNFGDLSSNAALWSSTESSSTSAWGRELFYYAENVARGSGSKTYGFSCRCLQGNQMLPTVSTITISNITQTTATSGGNVTSDGGATVTARGVCWSTSSTPTIAGSHSTDGSGTGTFVSNLTGLTANTLYYVRAYATNSVGTAYGNEVTFTTLSFQIGQSYGGGIVFYIDWTGQHGLIAASTDQSTDAQWGCFNLFIGGTSTSIGTGLSNTNAIVNSCTTSGIAARICYDLILNGYSDWFLPSKDELNQMYIQKNIIGGFINNNYWSSSEVNSGTAWCQHFGTGVQTNNLGKANTRWVRAIRTF